MCCLLQAADKATSVKKSQKAAATASKKAAKEAAEEAPKEAVEEAPKEAVEEAASLGKGAAEETVKEAAKEAAEGYIDAEMPGPEYCQNFWAAAEGRINKASALCNCVGPQHSFDTLCVRA